MRLYHPRYFLIGLLFILVTGCSAPQVTQGLINVSISMDGKTAEVQVAAGSTVQDLLKIASVELNPLDRVDPPLYTVLSEGSRVQLVRVTEEFTVEEVVVPFEKQVIRNESLPEGETRLIQPGVNGSQEITYRRVYEDGVEVSASPVKFVIVQDAVPEIVMVGSQTPFAPAAIPGKLAYLSSGNAWVMETNSGNRRPVVTSGDLDGRVFKLSPEGDWLLFTRRSDEEGTINTLWAAKIDDDAGLEIDLQAANVVHFADWAPTSVLRVAYSTVEPRTASPGWQANNDLRLISFSTSGWVSRQTVALDANSGGIYGWWGMSFTWAPDGLQLGYTRPDGIGLLDLQAEDNPLTKVFEITPLQTQSDWAWVPGLDWSPAGNVLYTVDHSALPGEAEPEASLLFDLVALPLEGGGPVTLVPQVGMFASPVASPMQIASSGEQAFQVAYLQAIFPKQSDTSRYRLVVMDRDGSNKRVLFPEAGAPGLEPQKVLWSPLPLDDTQQYKIALIYQGNLWLVDPVSGAGQQLTGDGLIDRLDWK